MFEAVRTYPEYGMATLIYNNLLNLILGIYFFLNYYIIRYLIKKTYLLVRPQKRISDSDCTAKNT